jgi:hypothetical protein
MANYTVIDNKALLLLVLERQDEYAGESRIDKLFISTYSTLVRDESIMRRSTKKKTRAERKGKHYYSKGQESILENTAAFAKDHEIASRMESPFFEWHRERS